MRTYIIEKEYITIMVWIFWDSEIQNEFNDHDHISQIKEQARNCFSKKKKKEQARNCNSKIFNIYNLIKTCIDVYWLYYDSIYSDIQLILDGI